MAENDQRAQTNGMGVPEKENAATAGGEIVAASSPTAGGAAPGVTTTATSGGEPLGGAATTGRDGCPKDAAATPRGIPAASSSTADGTVGDVSTSTASEGDRPGDTVTNGKEIPAARSSTSAEAVSGLNIDSSVPHVNTTTRTTGSKVQYVSTRTKTRTSTGGEVPDVSAITIERTAPERNTAATGSGDEELDPAGNGEAGGGEDATLDEPSSDTAVPLLNGLPGEARFLNADEVDHKKVTWLQKVFDIWMRTDDHHWVTNLLSYLLGQGGSVDARYPSGDSLLHRLVDRTLGNSKRQRRRAEMIDKVVLAASRLGRRIDWSPAPVSEWSVLHTVCAEGASQSIERLIHSGADPFQLRQGYTLIDTVIMQDDLDASRMRKVLRLLLSLPGLAKHHVGVVQRRELTVYGHCQQCTLPMQHLLHRVHTDLTQFDLIIILEKGRAISPKDVQLSGIADLRQTLFEVFCELKGLDDAMYWDIMVNAGLAEPHGQDLTGRQVSVGRVPVQVQTVSEMTITGQSSGQASGTHPPFGQTSSTHRSSGQTSGTYSSPSQTSGTHTLVGQTSHTHPPFRQTSGTYQSPRQTSGTHPSSRQTSGTHPSSRQTSGIHPLFGQTSGTQPSSRQTSGIHSSPRQTSGTQPLSRQTSDIHPLSGQTSGTQPLSNQTSGIHSSPRQTSSTHSSSGQTSGAHRSSGQTSGIESHSGQV